MPRARILCIDEVKLEPATKKDAEETMKLLEDNAQQMKSWINEADDELDEESMLAEEEDHKEDEEAEKEDDGDEFTVTETAEDKVARHKAAWEKSMKKYQKYASKGKVEKLERAKARQMAKLEKAKEKGKPDVYIDYKAMKIEYTKNMIKTAQLVHNLKKSGLMK